MSSQCLHVDPKRDSPQKKSTMTLADFTRGSTDTMDLRLINSRQSSSTSEGTQSPKASVVFSGSWRCGILIHASGNEPYSATIGGVDQDPNHFTIQVCLVENSEELLKDLFMRKIRQFTFKISNLFGTSKPFSCDVEIRHADQLTMLPIEVM